jgi:hypothetical protein
MSTTILWQSALMTDTANSGRSTDEAAEQGAAANSALHDDYCAIHDEYRTCTCGAEQMSAESREEE